MQTVDIVDVVGDFVQLKKKGKDFWACCPFHHEKSPSFSVAPGKNIFKCFGCGKAGDSVTFVMEVERLSYSETIRYLAQKYNIEIEETVSAQKDQEQKDELDSLYIVLNYAKEYYKKILHEDPTGIAVGKSYFKERGFSEKTIQTFDLGFSLDEWDGLKKSAEKSQFNPVFLERAGLLIKSENNDRVYDRFRGRAIFPIHNGSGKVVAFGARILKADKNQPKYINSPETEVYHKSRTLYGLYQAKNAIRAKENCYMVEGYTDVISLHQAGIEHVVASAGTSLTVEQIRLLGRFTKTITVVYDGDAAGIKASLRGIDLILEEGLNVRAVLMPPGEDPDSFARSNPQEVLESYLNQHAKDFLTFKTELYLDEIKQDPIRKVAVIHDIVESITKIPDAIARSVFFQQCSQLLGIDQQVLIGEYNKLMLKKGKKEDPSTPISEPPTLEEIEKKTDQSTDLVQLTLENQEKETIRLLLNYSHEPVDETTLFGTYFLVEIQEVEFEHPLYKKMITMYREAFSNGLLLDTQVFISNDDIEVRNSAIELLSNRYELSDNWIKHDVYVKIEKDNLTDVIYKSLNRLKWRHIKNMLKENLSKIMNATSEEELQNLQVQHMHLKEAEKIIAKILGNVTRA